MHDHAGISRRQFLKLAAAVSGSLAMPLPLMAATVSQRFLLTGAKHNVVKIDLNSWEVLKAIDIGFQPHSYLRRKDNPDRFWVIQRYADKGVTDPFKAVEIDVKQGVVTQVIESPKHSEFRGHGFIAPESGVLYICRFDASTNLGMLTGYNPDTGKQVEDHAICKGFLHECQYGGDNSVIFADAGGRIETDADGKETFVRHEHSSITRYNLKSGKITSYAPSVDEDQMIDHFIFLRDGRLVALSRPALLTSGLPGKIFIGKEGEKLVPLEFSEAVPPGNSGEMLNMAVDNNSNVLAVTNPDNYVVIKVDLESTKMVSQLRSPLAHGVVFDEQTGKFVLSGRGIGTSGAALASISPVKVKDTMEDRSLRFGHPILFS